MEAKSTDLVRIGELELFFKVNERSATVFEFVVPSRARVPAPHHHDEADEILYGLGGVLTVTVNGLIKELGPGESLFIPRGSVHHHENLHAEPSRTLVVITPGTITRTYFEELAEVINVPGKPNLAHAQQIMMNHGLVPA